MLLLIALFVMNMEALGLLGTNTMQSSCMIDDIYYINTLWDSQPCAFTISSFLVAMLFTLMVYFIFSLFSKKLMKHFFENRKAVLLECGDEVLSYSLIVYLLSYETFDVLKMAKVLLGSIILFSPILIFKCLSVFLGNRQVKSYEK